MKIEDDGRGNCPGNPIAAVLDIEARNKANIGNFTAAQKQLAQRLNVLVAAAYNCKTYPPNYRGKEITVKAENWHRQVEPQYTQLVAFCDANNIKCRRTKTSADIFVIS